MDHRRGHSYIFKVFATLYKVFVIHILGLCQMLFISIKQQVKLLDVTITSYDLLHIHRATYPDRGKVPWDLPHQHKKLESCWQRLPAHLTS